MSNVKNLAKTLSKVHIGEGHHRARECLGCNRRATPHTTLKACDYCVLRSRIGRKDRTVQVHFTLKGQGPSVLGYESHN